MKKLNIICRYAFTFVCLSLIFSVTAQGASVISSVDRNQVSMNETLTLMVTYDEQVNSSQLDLSQLEADFDILGVSPRSSSSISIVNGKSTRQASTVWTVTLAPKREGQLTIPVFSIDNNASKVIAITVGNKGQSNANDQPLQVRVSADHNSIYAAQQLLVEVELSAQSDISDLNGPQLIVNGAEVEFLGQQNFQRIENGVPRQIVVLKYAVFARESGELVIPVMSFTGVKGGQRSLFDSFGGRGQQVIARSKQLAIAVKETPEAKAAPWFPAENVTISSEWSGDISALKVGEPITRTIKITANGQRASVIPPLRRPATADGFKAYKDQPQLDDKTGAGGFTGIRIESEAIVASNDGQLLLPELKLDWWNVNEQQWQEATLPAETLTVTGAAISTEFTEKMQAKPQISEKGVGRPTAFFNSNQGWKIISGLLLIIIAIQMWLILKTRITSPKSAAIDLQDTSEAKAWEKLQTTFIAADAAAIRKHLINWAQIALPDARHASLQSLADYSGDSELRGELTKLDGHLYNDRREFNADRLASIVRQLRQQAIEQNKNLRKQAGALQPLYR